MRLAIFCILVLSWSGSVLAGGGSSPFSKSKLEQLPKFSKQQVFDAEDLFVYHGLVYKFDKFRPTGPIPKYHKGIFDRIKREKNSEISDDDVKFHNGKLQKFLSDFKNVVGALEN